MMFLLGLFIGGIVGFVGIAICATSGRADLDMKVLELEGKLMKSKKEKARLRREIKKHKGKWNGANFKHFDYGDIFFRPKADTSDLRFL